MTGGTAPGFRAGSAGWPGPGRCGRSTASPPYPGGAHTHLPPPVAAVVKFHASRNVSDGDRSVAFSAAFLGVPPAEHDPDHVKFETGGPLNRLGLRPRGGNGGMFFVDRGRVYADELDRERAVGTPD